jgi:hypothetical protein
MAFGGYLPRANRERVSPLRYGTKGANLSSFPVKLEDGVGGPVMYWVAYRKGSFSLKEQYRCRMRAGDRALALAASADDIEVVPQDEAVCYERILMAQELPAR